LRFGWYYYCSRTRFPRVSACFALTIIRSPTGNRFAPRFSDETRV